MPTIAMHLHYVRAASTVERRFCYYDRVLLPGRRPSYEAHGFDHLVRADGIKWFPPWYVPHFEHYERTVDVAFIGTTYPAYTNAHRYRSRLLAQVRLMGRDGIRAVVENGISYTTVQQLYAQSKIVIDYATEGRHLSPRAMEA
ncbi:MAG: hypothetical protein O3A46_11370, partial [Candidatus Poribacteria bacterium]|nr:hypothetical protein [Candidatus Poribacteria bacterium]